MAQNKTKQTRVTPASFIATIAGEQQRKDSEELIAMMRTITREPPKMWGASIVGFGSRQYVLASGRESEICLIGFSPRKPSLVLYLGEVVRDARLMSRLGKYTAGKGCLYIKTLDDLDRGVLHDLITRAVEGASGKS
jgi:hypothetical protein